MKIDELFSEPKIEGEILLEGKLLEIYEAIGPLLVVEDGDGGGAAPGGGGGPDGGGMGGSSPGAGGMGGPPAGGGGPPPTMPGGTPPGCAPGNGMPGGNIGYGGSWFGRGPFNPGRGGGGMNGNHWFNEFYNSMKYLTIATKIKKRLKQLKVKGPGAARVSQAASTALKSVRDLIKNPMNTAYRVGSVGTFAKLPKPKLKIWNEMFQYEFKKELAKTMLNEEEENLVLHDYKKGEIVTVIDSPATRSLVNQKLTVVKQINKVDGKYVVVRGKVEADVKVTLINSVEKA